jgi:hypothetical protein
MKTKTPDFVFHTLSASLFAEALTEVRVCVRKRMQNENTIE